MDRGKRNICSVLLKITNTINYVVSLPHTPSNMHRLYSTIPTFMDHKILPNFKILPDITRYNEETLIYFNLKIFRTDDLQYLSNVRCNSILYYNSSLILYVA